MPHQVELSRARRNLVLHSKTGIIEQVAIAAPLISSTPRIALHSDWAMAAKACDMLSAFDEMIDLARRLGITVRHAHLGGSGGGLAMVKGTRQLFVDLDAEPADQLERTAKALGKVGGLEMIYIRPDVRALVEQYTSQGNA